jgi:hypothetical protein
MDRFYIIWSSQFGQVYILDLPLLQTWIINPYAPSQKILLIGLMRPHYCVPHFYPYYYPKQ